MNQLLTISKTGQLYYIHLSMSWLTHKSIVSSPGDVQFIYHDPWYYSILRTLRLGGQPRLLER